MIQIKNWLRSIGYAFAEPFKPNTRMIADCPECIQFLRSRAAVRMARHLGCKHTGHGLNQDATLKTLAHVIRLLDAENKRLRFPQGAPVVESKGKTYAR